MAKEDARLGERRARNKIGEDERKARAIVIGAATQQGAVAATAVMRDQESGASGRRRALVHCIGTRRRRQGRQK